MNRAIKFRQPVFNNDGSFSHWHYWGWISEGNFVSPMSMAHNVKGVKGFQYTALKDKNGKEIYGGDIITLTYGIPSTSDKLVIEYANNEVVEDISVSGWWMRNINKYRHSGSLCKTYESDIEIIGNIYENPELL